MSERGGGVEGEALKIVCIEIVGFNLDPVRFLIFGRLGL